MNLTRRARLLLLAMAGITLVLAVLLLFARDRGAVSAARELAKRLDRADHDRVEALMFSQGQDVLRPLASQIDATRGALVEEAEALAKDAGLQASVARKSKADPRALLQGLLDPRKALFSEAALADKKGLVLAAWPASNSAKDLSKDELFKEVANPNWPTGIALSQFVKFEKPAAKPMPNPRFAALVSIAVGLEDVTAAFNGMLLLKTDTARLLGADPALVIKGFASVAPTGSLMLLQGTGEELFHQRKGPYLERLDQISADYKAVLASIQAAPEGKQWVSNYDGKPGLLVWRRIGNAWNPAQGPKSLLALLAFLPEADFRLKSAAVTEDPRAFYADPLAWLLLLVLVLGPLGFGLFSLEKTLLPWQRMARGAQAVLDGGQPDLSLEDDGGDRDLHTVSQALAQSSERALANDLRVKELDQALRRLEEQAGRDATSANRELSELREQLNASDGERSAANSKFEAAQAARSDAEAQLGNLKTALETASKNNDLKSQEIKALNAQVQDLLRAVEEQRKVAEKTSEGMVKKDGEVVRLSAINTLNAELKATLGVIRNYISTMLGSAGAISDAQQEFLGVVINKSARLERLINDLVELSEIGSGLRPLRVQQEAPGTLIQEVLLNARPQAENKKISLDYAENGQIAPMGLDRDKFSGLVQALINQAIKVTSRSEKISLLLSEREGGLELRLSDPGMSLPPDRAAKVFNQFHGVDSQAGPEFIGTGLRFPIARAVAEAHGGKIWIESQVGRGKTIVLSIPKGGAKPQAGGLPAMPPPGLGAPTPPPSLPPLKAPTLAPPAPAAPKADDFGGFASVFGGTPPGAPPAPLAAPKAEPIIHKPAPLPEDINAPWRAGKETPKDPSLEDALGLPPLRTKAEPTALPSLPPMKTAGGQGPLAADDKDSFDKVFGALPPQAEALKGGLPKVELKTNAQLSDADTANFAALFGGPAVLPAAAVSTPAPAPVSAPVPAAPPAADPFAAFAAAFGGDLPTPKGPPPPPGAVPAPPPPGLVPSGPPPGVVPSPPPRPAGLPADMAAFDALFSPPAAAPAPKPAPPAAGGGLNTLDDLNNMLQ